jgi:hypothetical protein
MLITLAQGYSVEVKQGPPTLFQFPRSGRNSQLAVEVSIKECNITTNFTV